LKKRRGVSAYNRTQNHSKSSNKSK